MDADDYGEEDGEGEENDDGSPTEMERLIEADPLL